MLREINTSSAISIITCEFALNNNNNNSNNNHKNNNNNLKSAKWVEEVKSAINSSVAAPRDEQFLLTKEESVNTIRKKRNWSAPEPDRITNYWWKKAYS